MRGVWGPEAVGGLIRSRGDLGVEEEHGLEEEKVIVHDRAMLLPRTCFEGLCAGYMKWPSLR